MTRTAISPRLAIKIFLGTRTYLRVAVTSVPNASNPSSLPILPTWPSGWSVQHVAETGSTNDDAVAAAHNGAPHRSVFVTDFQTAGKGRLDRTWEATRGSNLLTSLLFRYENEDAFRFSRIVALAGRAACIALSGVTPALKWPNDLVIDGAKLGGLLAVGAPRDRFVVVGIGVNVGWSPPDAVSLRDRAVTKDSVTPLALLALMLNEIDTRLVRSDAELHAEHKAALATLGQRVRVELHAGESVVGVAEDLDGAGRLLVRSDDMQLHEIGVGDVVHLRAH